MHIVPERATDLPQERRESGHYNLGFQFSHYGALFDGVCVARFPLPDTPSPPSARDSGTRRSRAACGSRISVWSENVRLNLEPYRAAYRAAAAGEPVARSVFDLYVTDGQLTYVKEECDQEDTEQRFFLHIVPERADDLPQERREHGFDNLDFDFFPSTARCSTGNALCWFRCPE